MKLNKNVISYIKPDDVDTSSSKSKVYLNKNITVEIVDGTELYKYDQYVYTKEEYSERKINDILNILNNYVDVDNLDLDSAKEYMIKEIGNACTKDIENGIDVKVGSTDSIEHFSLTREDQSNMDTQLINILLLDMRSVAYHANGKVCKFYDALEFLKIVLTGKAKILQSTTYCNALINYIRNLSTKEEVLKCYYGMELPENITNEMNKIISNQVSILSESIKNKYGIVIDL